MILSDLWLNYSGVNSWRKPSSMAQPSALWPCWAKPPGFDRSDWRFLAVNKGLSLQPWWSKPAIETLDLSFILSFLNQTIWGSWITLIGWSHHLVKLVVDWFTEGPQDLKALSVVSIHSSQKIMVPSLHDDIVKPPFMIIMILRLRLDFSGCTEIS